MATKTVYQTDLDRFYLWPVQANELPFAKGFFNIPNGAYEDAPPASPEGYGAQRDLAGTAWAVVEDHRAETLYLVGTNWPYAFGSELLINDVSQSYPGWGPLPAWLTVTATNPEQDD